MSESERKKIEQIRQKYPEYNNMDDNQIIYLYNKLVKLADIFISDLHTKKNADSNYIY